MASKLISLTFVESSEAALWPEGSKVAAMRFAKNTPLWNDFSISSFHRPDWLTPTDENFSRYLAQYHYALIEDAPKVEKRKAKVKRRSK